MFGLFKNPQLEEKILRGRERLQCVIENAAKEHRIPKVLIVEDCEDDLLLTMEKIKQSGVVCEISVAKDGKSAIAQICRTEFDVIVLDIKLNGVSGIDVMDTFGGEKPFVVLTGLGEGVQTEEAYQHGAKFVFDKNTFKGVQFRAVLAATMLI